MFRALTISSLGLLAVAGGCIHQDSNPSGGSHDGGSLGGVGGAASPRDLAMSQVAVDLASLTPGNPTPADMSSAPDLRRRMRPSGKLFFTTSADYTGDIIDQGVGSSGLQVGDYLCTTLATAASLGGTWKAWLSDRTHDAIDRIADVGPWYLLDGTMVFQNKANLQTAPMVQPILDENGATVHSMYVWTGAAAVNSDGSFDCDDWGGGAAKTGSVGNPSLKAQWNRSGPLLDCSTQAHIYCIEQ